ncbi:hypothetical protein BJ912DRAFT_979011 [Pholiota molesta]|nr:hypothetical protein BJ912DRAFT_979011 [Pholiota molesta]
MASTRHGTRKPYTRPATRGDVDGQWLHDKAPTGPRGRATAPRAPAAATLPAAAINTKLLDLIAVFGQIGTLVREPLLRYDRSGRSIGSAIISFETAIEATRAKKQFDGYLAKGQPMSIAYDTMPPRAPRLRRAVSAPTTASLLNRIEKPPLAERLSVDDSSAKIPSGPRAFTGGPVRTRAARGARAPKAPKKPKTAEELDKELDAFMGDAEASPATAATAGTDAAQDVDMV